MEIMFLISPDDQKEKTEVSCLDMNVEIPICVDLDGTLLWTDLLWESIFTLLKEKPYLILILPFWLFGGKAVFKSKLADLIELDIHHLPYNQPFLDYLLDQQKYGRSLILVTASHEKLANKIAEHLGIFSDVFSTNQEINLSGLNKRDLLISKFGERGFDYAGNSQDDLIVWPSARNAILVNSSPKILNIARKTSHVSMIFSRRSFSIIIMTRALRVHQWAKNILVFIPLFAAHQEKDPLLFGKSLLAFFAFCLCASATYMINDLFDLSSDRRHPRKRHRPFASGLLPLSSSLIFIPILLGLSFASVLFLPTGFFLILGIYLFLTLAYSLWIKRIVILDIIILAVLYTLRIIAGGNSIGAAPSFWLLAFSVFFFLSLAMVKRYSELLISKRAGQIMPHGRGYHTEDFPLINSLGTASGYGSVLVLALYINSPEIQSLYRHPKILWALIPILLYWISRVWLITHRGQMHDDPVIFALRDKVSLALAVLVAIAILGAT